MHVALVHMRSAKIGGTETFLNQLTQYLCEHGHEVTIVCRSHEGAPHPRAKLVVLRGFAPLASMRVLRFARDVEKHVREHAYDVVVGLGRTWSQDVIRMGGGCHVTYLEQAHDKTHFGPRQWLGRHSAKHRLLSRIEARALAQGAYRRVVVNSNFVREDLVARYGVEESAIRTIRNAVDLERFHPRNKAEAGARLRKELGFEAKPVVLFLGSAFGRKGLDLLLEAHAILQARLPGVQLLVVGRDAQMSHWKRMAERLGASDSVTFLGRRADSEACLGAADLCVLPTRYDSFAYTVLEALATGLPVVVSDAAGAADIVTPEAGTVLPWRSTPAQLADAIAPWFDPGMLGRGAEAARVLAENHGAGDAQGEFLALLSEVAAEKSGLPTP